MENDKKVFNSVQNLNYNYIQIEPNLDKKFETSSNNDNVINNQKLSINNKITTPIPSEGILSKQSTFQLNKIDKENFIHENSLSSQKIENVVEIDQKVKENKEKKDDYIITLRNLHKTYLIGVEGVPALRGVSLSIKRGEFVVILGTSGGGKTTLLNLIGTIDCPSRGDLKIFEHVVRSKTDDAILSMIRLEKIAFVFQNFNLLQNLNVLENVELPMKIKGQLSSEEITTRALSLLTTVGLANRTKHFPNQLSGGEQQRVTISRALSNQPEILLLDEPTGDLDTKNSDIVMNILMNLNQKENITMIMVTHDVGLKYYGNRVVKMVDGKVHAIENIDNNLRIEAIRKLNHRINNLETLQIKEGGKNSEMVNDELINNINKPSMTFIRKVSDYEIKRLSNK